MCTLTCNIVFFTSTKTESIKLSSTNESLLYGNLVYKVENSTAEIEYVFLLLLSLLIASITGLLYCTI